MRSYASTLKQPYNSSTCESSNERVQAELAAYIRTVRVRDAKQALFNTQRFAAFTANSLTQVVNGIYRNAGFDGASSHSGRRSFATNLANQGTGIRVLMRLMGHRNISSTAVYIDANDDMLRRAVELA